LYLLQKRGWQMMYTQMLFGDVEQLLQTRSWWLLHSKSTLQPSRWWRTSRSGACRHSGRQACMQQLLVSSHGILPAAAIPFLDQTERLVSSCSTPARDLRTRVLGFRSLESQGLGFIAPLAVRRMCCWRWEPFLLWKITRISGCRSRVCTFEDVGLLSTYVVCSMGGNTFMPRSIGNPF
jgi:hypothetical protein